MLRAACSPCRTWAGAKSAVFFVRLVPGSCLVDLASDSERKSAPDQKTLVTPPLELVRLQFAKTRTLPPSGTSSQKNFDVAKKICDSGLTGVKAPAELIFQQKFGGQAPTKVALGGRSFSPVGQ